MMGTLHSIDLSPRSRNSLATPNIRFPQEVRKMTMGWLLG